jgi:hypothetical protein
MIEPADGGDEEFDEVLVTLPCLVFIIIIIYNPHI